MVSKICTQCEKTKPLHDFDTPGTSKCFACRSDNFHAWYLAHETEHNNKNRLKRVTQRFSFGHSVAGPIEWLAR